MASVARDLRHKRRNWICCFTDGQGRQRKKSSGTTDYDTALRMSLKLEKAARLGARDELTERRARELISELLEDVTAGKETVRVITTRAFMQGWLAGKRALLAEGSTWTYKSAIEGFLDHLGKRADRPLTAVQTTDVQDYVSAMVRLRKAPKTIGVHVKILRSAFKAARLQQLITFNVAEAVQIPRGQSAERGTFSPAELALVLASADDDWRSVVMLGAYTGQRLRDCADIRWQDVSFTDGTVTFRVKKRHGAKLVVPMHPALRAHLEAIAGDTAEKYVAPSLANREASGNRGLSMDFARLMKRAGVEAGEAEVHGTRRLSSRSFHSLRHGFISGLANAGIPEELRMKLAGHADAKVHGGYTHHELAVLAAAIGKLPGIG